MTAIAVCAVGLFVNALAAFVLLPAVVGYCAARFFRRSTRRSLWDIERIGLLSFFNMTKLRDGWLLIVTFPFMDTTLRFKSVHQQLTGG